MRTKRTLQQVARYPAYFLVTFLSFLAGCETTRVRQDPPVYYPSQPAPAYGEDIRRCRADNQRAHAEVVDSYERARQAGHINPAEAQQFNAMEGRLRNMRADLARDGLTLQDCQRIGGAIARERSEVARMSRYDPAVARSQADNRRAHDEVYKVYNDGTRSGRINAGEAQRFKTMEERLRNYQAELKRDGLSLAECQRVGGAIARERVVVDDMVR